nr:ABC transporter substrate-binding protein [Chloroflexota bacterium]
MFLKGRGYLWTSLLTGVLVLSLTLGACAPQPTPTPTPMPPTPVPAQPTPVPATPTPVPVKYNEAPMLAELVKAGKLPPVEQRLPENPLVVPVVEEIGQYGGVWRRAFLGPADANNYVRVVYDSLVRFSPDGGSIEPKIAEGWEVSQDLTTWTIKLRKGAKWSDGAPMTADDIMFWYNDVLLNTDLTPSLPGWMKNKDGSPALVEKVDDYTVRWVYKQPNGFFLTELANKDGGDRTYAVFLPAHYLKQFHPKYTPQEEIDKIVKAEGFNTWAEMFAAKNAPPENPERPTMAAWVPTTRVSDPVLVLKRNPYYIGVDPAGNQLPYIDEVRFTFFADAQALNLAAIAGEFDLQARHINMANYPVLKENEAKGKYRVITWPTFGGSDAAVWFNQTYDADPEIATLLRTKDFRIALSYAINREQIKESVFLGLGEPRQCVPAPWHPYYPGDEWAKKYTEYRPDEANRLLDSIGLTKKDAEGFRLLPSGKRVILEINVTPAFGPWPDVAQLIARDWEQVGIKTIVQIRERALTWQMRDNNELQVEMWNDDTTGFPFTGNSKFDPRDYPQPAFGPLYQRWYATDGKEGVEPPPEVKKIVEIIDSAELLPPEEQVKPAQELFKYWVDNCWKVGTIGLTPMVQGVVVVSNNFRNVPTTLGNDWPLRTPGNARTEQFFFKQ